MYIEVAEALGLVDPHGQHDALAEPRLNRCTAHSLAARLSSCDNVSDPCMVQLAWLRALTTLLVIVVLHQRNAREVRGQGRLAVSGALEQGALDERISFSACIAIEPYVA